ncbi:MAG: hypothetical protein ABJF50_24135 [Paracoccaceae bacterium]
MSRPLEVLLHHMRGFASSPDKWEADFARSIQRQAKDPKWRPSQKQKAIMDRMVAELFDEEPVVIE